MALNAARAYTWRAEAVLVATVWAVSAWLFVAGPCQATDATLTVAIASTPALSHIRPRTDLARLTLTVSQHSVALSQGHVKLRLSAPPRSTLPPTGAPSVEGTALVALDSEWRDGTITLQYAFPIRGLYTFDLEITPVPGGPAFPPTNLRKTVRIAAQPGVVRAPWLRVAALFVVGAVLGVLCERSMAARGQRLRRSIVALLGLCYGVLAPVSTASAHPGHAHQGADAAQGYQVIRGVDGWELEIHTSPEPATVGSLVQVSLWLRKDGVVFPGHTAVSLAVTNLDAGQTVVETDVLASEGRSSQGFQLYDGGLHAITVAVRPAGGEEHTWTPPVAVLNLDVVALATPLGVQIRQVAMWLGVLVAGLAVGLSVPRLAR